MEAPAELDADRGVYGISVAAELAGMGVQTLRLYESRGLLEPDRTTGGTRRYSANDLDRLRRIAELLSAGLNLAGIGMVLALEAENARLRAERARPAARPRQSHPGETPPTSPRTARVRSDPRAPAQQDIRQSN
jgi:DNA-binding transcriptional MerR regulator